MLTTLLAVLPVFVLIGTGFLSGRFAWLGPAAITELNRFTVVLALPAILFEVMAQADWPTLWDTGFVLSFTGGSAALFVATILVRRPRLPTLSEASLDGLNASYPNVGYIGFPLCDAVFGRDSFGLVTLSVILVTSLLFGVATVLVELGRAHRATGHGRTLLLALLKNPILVAPILGAALSLAGIPLPAFVARFVHLLGAAASPCALVALGLFLSASAAAPSRPGLPLTLTALKLFAQPALTALLAYVVFRLPPQTAAICTLLSALPTGSGSFMLAEKYGLPALVTSRTILFSTVLSVLTLTAILLLVPH